MSHNICKVCSLFLTTHMAQMYIEIKGSRSIPLMSQVIALTLSTVSPKQGCDPRFPSLWTPARLKRTSRPLIHPAGDRALTLHFPLQINLSLLLHPKNYKCNPRSSTYIEEVYKNQIIFLRMAVWFAGLPTPSQAP